MGKTGFLLRNSDQVNMIGYQTEADDAQFIFRAVFLEKCRVALAILVGEEHVATIVAFLVSA